MQMDRIKPEHDRGWLIVDEIAEHCGDAEARRAFVAAARNAEGAFTSGLITEDAFRRVLMSLVPQAGVKKPTLLKKILAQPVGAPVVVSREEMRFITHDVEATLYLQVSLMSGEMVLFGRRIVAEEDVVAWDGSPPVAVCRLCNPPDTPLDRQRERLDCAGCRMAKAEMTRRLELLERRPPRL
jgi:hypothetical protein